MYVGLNKDNTEVVGIGEKTCKISPRHKKSMDEAVFLIRELLPQASSVILYGSCARSKAKYESDVDLFVVCDDTDDSSVLSSVRTLKSKAAEIESPPVDIHFYKESSYNSNGDVYIDCVKKDGVTIWKR